MTKQQLFEKILAVYEEYYWASIAKNNEDERGLEAWLEDVAPQEENILSLGSPAAMLGSIKSKRKAAASRENGKKGGRPKTPPPHTNRL